MEYIVYVPRTGYNVYSAVAETREQAIEKVAAAGGYFEQCNPSEDSNTDNWHTEEKKE